MDTALPDRVLQQQPTRRRDQRLAADTAARLGEYTGLVAGTLGDRVKLCRTLDEPFVHTAFGRLFATHAPGVPGDLDALAVVHHQLPGHG